MTLSPMCVTTAARRLEDRDLWTEWYRHVSTAVTTAARRLEDRDDQHFVLAAR